MSDINWEVKGKIYKTYNDIWGFLFNSDGRIILENEAKKSLDGEYLPVENSGRCALEKFLFGKSYTEGYIDGFQRGFREGGKAMEIEVQNE